MLKLTSTPLPSILSSKEAHAPLLPPKLVNSRTYGTNNAFSKQWTPDVNMLLSTKRWLELFGLKKHKLELKQILSSIGFKHCEEYVRPLQKPVKANYSKGMFPQYACEDGTTYNLLANYEKLETVKSKLQQIIEFFQERLEWVTSSSRLLFGVVEEQSVAIVLDMQPSTEEDLCLLKNALGSLIREQLMFISKFNFIRCAEENRTWQNNSINVSKDSIEGVLFWIQQLTREPPYDATSTIDALLQAAKDDQLECIYLCTDGLCFDSASQLLKRKLDDLPIPVHIVAMNCASESALNFLRETTKHSKGRFHKFCLYGSADNGELVESFAKNGGSGLSGLLNHKSWPKLETGMRHDVVELWEELDRARNIMAEIEAMQFFVNEQKPNVAISTPDHEDKLECRKEKIGNELCMSSKEWLKKHSLHSRKLGFYDVLQNMAFRHCDGVVEVPNPSGKNTIATIKSKLVNAKYCDKFAHVRWKDGQIFHVHISGEVHRNYERRVMAALESYEKRIQWLRKGSRELFGTIIEDQVTILIDTSSSMNSRLFLVKDKLYQLLQEQIKHKRKFNLIKFDSRVTAWRSRLIDCTDRNIDDAWQWIKGLVVGGSTNTLGALKLALSDPLCSAVYLLTDGRPDQPNSTIMSQIQLQSPIPIHTISFNCSDESANEFLFKLSEMTNARFHYFSENGDNSNDLKVYQSEDVRLIKDEIEKGTRDLERLTRLRNWCAQLDWYDNTVKKTTTRTPARPSSAPLIGASEESGRSFRPRSVGRKKTKKRTVKYENKATPSRQSSSSSIEIVKSESNVDDDAKTLVVKSDVEDKEEKRELSPKEKTKRRKKAKRKIIPHSCVKNDVDDVGVTKSPSRGRKVGTPSSTGKKPSEKSQSLWIRNHKVLARSNVDGFYYPGALRVNVNSRYADVVFGDVESQVVSLRHIIPNEGSRPCPSLKVGDYVLAKKVRDGRPSCYVPGIVYVVPLRQSKATKYYTIIYYNGAKATALRKDIVKVSQTRYTFTCRYIKDCQMTTNTSSEMTAFDPQEREHNSFRAVNSDTQSSRSSLSEDDLIDAKEKNGEDNVASDKYNDKIEDEKNDEQKKNDNVSSPDETDGRLDGRKKNDELETVKQAVLETRESQIKYFEKQQERFRELQEQVKEAMEEQARRQEEFKKQYEEFFGKKGSSSGSSESGGDSKSLPDEVTPGCAHREEPEKQLEKDNKLPSKIQFHVSSENKEACLWTKGSHGLLISRAPLTDDPAVEARSVPKPLRNGDEVLARWSDDGWYYRGTVREISGDNYLIEDSVGNMEEISRKNILSDQDDAAHVIQVNDAVIALHPSFSFSYAPGIVVNIGNEMYNVRFYDGREDLIPREEIYYLTHDKFSASVHFIVRCEESLVGQAVVARNDSDGLFYLANVRDRVGNGRQYIIEWPDNTTQVQSSSFLFGAHTKRHQLSVGDRVLALSDNTHGIYEPGWITGVSGKKLNIKFNSKKRSLQVDPLQCFWLSSDYYERAVEYIGEITKLDKNINHHMN